MYPVGAGQIWRAASGGRAPSDDERRAVEEAIAEIQSRNAGVRAPALWFVLDEWELNAAVFGDALMITTPTTNDVGLTAVIAHELGHLNSPDCHLSAALGRLAWPAEIFVRIFDRFEEGGCLLGLRSLAGSVCSGLIVVMPVRQARRHAGARGARGRPADAVSVHLGARRTRMRRIASTRCAARP